MKKVAVVIPFYTSNINEYEKTSLEQCFQVLGAYDVIFAVPQSMKENDVPHRKNTSCVRFSDDWFSNVTSYNRLMLSALFYESFLEYEYILIYQLDAFVFKDELLEFCNLDYDYYGAPWYPSIEVHFDDNPGINPKILKVGNGGFSLRKVETFLRYLDKASFLPLNMAEDVFYAFNFNDELSIAPVEVARKFSIEQNVEQGLKELGGLPFGCHQWYVHNSGFWKPIIEKSAGIVFNREIGFDTNNDNLRSMDERSFLWRFSSRDSVKTVLQEMIGADIDTCRLYQWGYGQYGRECEWLLFRNGFKPAEIIDNTYNGQTLLYNKQTKRIEQVDWNEKTVVIISIKRTEKILKLIENYSIRNYVFFEDLRVELCSDYLER